jgi:hypothetical protein
VVKRARLNILRNLDRAGVHVTSVAALAIKHGKSVDFKIASAQGCPR